MIELTVGHHWAADVPTDTYNPTDALLFTTAYRVDSTVDAWLSVILEMFYFSSSWCIDYTTSLSSL